VLTVLDHISDIRKCPIYLDEKAIQALGVKGALSFVDAWKKFQGSKPKAGSQSYVCIENHPQCSNKNICEPHNIT
jgi:hypothetical protein